MMDLPAYRTPEPTGASNRQMTDKKIDFGNETLNSFLGGGLLNSTLNLFEREGFASRVLDSVWNKSFAGSTLSRQDTLIVVNFNALSEINEDDFLASLPASRQVKAELMHINKSTSTKINIAWRYTDRTISPVIPKIDQIDFSLPLVKYKNKEDLGRLVIINVREESPDSVIRSIINNLHKYDCNVNILVKDLIHPTSPLIQAPQRLLEFLYALRCLSRTIPKGAILLSYDRNMCPTYPRIKDQIYNICDSVVAFYHYETDQKYEDVDGALEYVKVPKLNSFGFQFKQSLSDWGYRIAKRFFVVEELSLPPCVDD